MSHFSQIMMVVTIFVAVGFLAFISISVIFARRQESPGRYRPQDGNRSVARDQEPLFFGRTQNSGYMLNFDHPSAKAIVIIATLIVTFLSMLGVIATVLTH